LTKDAEAAGADAVLSVVPYYNKPTQLGLYAHFREIAQSAGLPVILYDVPSRTVCGLGDETVARLAEIPRIIGLKDAAGDVTRPARLRALIGPDFRLLSGDDAFALAYFAQRGDGCISVTSNVAPGLCRNMYLAWKQGHLARAQRLARPVAQLTTALFCESNPVPLKYALNLLGLTPARVRPPLVELSSRSQVEVAGVLTRLCDEYSEDMIGEVRDHSLASRRAVTGWARYRLLSVSQALARIYRLCNFAIKRVPSPWTLRMRGPGRKCQRSIRANEPAHNSYLVIPASGAPRNGGIRSQKP